MDPDADPPEPPAEHLRVRHWPAVARNRRSRLALAALLFMGILAHSTGADLQSPTELTPTRLGGNVLGALIVLALIALAAPGGPYFQYEPRSGRVGRKTLWRSWRFYPRRGYARLECSPERGTVHEVAADGRRRRLPIAATWANRSDWRQFVESIHPEAR